MINITYMLVVLTHTSDLYLIELRWFIYGIKAPSNAYQIHNFNIILSYLLILKSSSSWYGQLLEYGLKVSYFIDSFYRSNLHAFSIKMLVSTCPFRWYIIQCRQWRKYQRANFTSYAPPSFLNLFTGKNN